MDTWRERCYVFIFLSVLAPSLAYVHSMSDDDRAYMERNFPRSRRDIGNLRVPINFGNLPRLDVVTIESAPYTFIDDVPSGAPGSVTSGYMVDLMYLVGRRLGFQVHFYTSPDGRYGQKDEQTGAWNGLIGEVIKREHTIQLNQSAAGTDAVGLYGADVAAAPLTITAEREMDMDFVKPFAHLGLTALMLKPKEQPDWPFDFSIFQPIDVAVWCTVIILGLAVWGFLYVMNRFNPYEYGRRMENNLATESEGALFNLSGSFWFMFTLLQWQGFERAPRCLASKILSGCWMLFVSLFLVVFTGSYINNLFWASMVHAVDPNTHPVKSLEDLVSGKYSYGTIKGGSTYKYFTEVAKGAEFDVVGEYLRSHPEMLVTSTPDGIEKIRTIPNYAFLCETMSAKYESNKLPCDLTPMTQTFGMRSYGLAVAKNSPLIDRLHVVVLELIEEGDIDALEKKWFEIKGDCWNKTKASDDEKARRSEVLFNKPKTVSFRMMLQVFGIMFVGIVISALVALAEILWFSYRGQYGSANRQSGEQQQQQILEP